MMEILMKFYLLFAMLFLYSCAPQQIRNPVVFSHEKINILHQETTTTDALVDADINNLSSLCQQLNKKSLQSGISELMHMYVKDSSLVYPAREQKDFFDQKITFRMDICEPWYSHVTDGFYQKISFTSSLIPIQKLSGYIDSMQDDLTMGGAYTRAYIVLLGESVMEPPIPVIIVQNSSGLTEGVAQIVGSGLITQVTERVGQMTIVESTREILPGDLFFQLLLQAESLPMGDEYLPLGLEDAGQ
jgi:hypothetical protein